MWNPLPILIWATLIVLAIGVSPGWWWAVGIWMLIMLVAALID